MLHGVLLHLSLEAISATVYSIGLVAADIRLVEVDTIRTAGRTS